VNDLIAFLRARLDEDEQAAREQQAFDEQVAKMRGSNVDAIIMPPLSLLGAPGDPARVLAEVEAKRRIIAEHFEEGYCCWTCSDKNGDSSERWPCPTLRLLVLPHAGHPDYRTEWRL
jgi:hypothetical protein